MKLSKIEIITGMSKLTGLKSVLSRAGVRGMTVVQVLGCGVDICYPEENRPLYEKLKESGLTRAELFARSSINPSYGYQLLSGLRSPARDTAVQLALGLALGVDDAQKLLRMAKLGALYPRDRRGRNIIFSLSGLLPLPQTNELLFSHSMNGLSK